MLRKILWVGAGLLVAAPLTAQVPEGMMMRVDRSTNAADPDDVPEVTVTAMGDGFQVSTGPAVVLWKADQTATRPFTLHGTFTLLEPSSHRNYYGLIYGGGALDTDRQNYMYFLVAQDGSYILKHRANNETVHDVVEGRVSHEAVNTPDANGRSVNELEVRVGADETQFVINGTVVHTQANSGMAGRTDGIWGVRVNHVIPALLVENLGISN